MQRISDNGDLEPLPFDNDPEMVRWAEYGIAQLKAHIKAQNAARAKYEQAQREQRNGIGLNELLGRKGCGNERAK